MGVAMHAVLFVAGLGLLGFGADRAVEGGTGLARALDVSPLFIGVTAISIGTSLPETATTVTGTLRGAGDLVVGGIIGSETAQITLALGTVALVTPVVVHRRTTRRYGGAMLAAMGLMVATLWDGRIERWEGLGLMVLYGAFLYVAYGRWERAPEAHVPEGVPVVSRRRAALWLALGSAMVVGGAYLAVDHGLALAQALGASTYLIGLLVGLGTTLPEVVVAMLSSWRGRGGLSVGTLLGSNVTDPLFSLGLGALVHPIAVTDVANTLRGGGLMIVLTAAALGLLYWRRRLGRGTGILFLALYLPLYLVR